MMRKPPAFKSLKPGDPWTFIVRDPMVIEDGNREARVGDMIGKWFSTDEPGRNFRIVRITTTPGSVAYETEFAGFQQFKDCA